MTIKLRAGQVRQLWHENNPETRFDCPVEHHSGEIVQTCPPQLGWGSKTLTRLDRGWLSIVRDYQLRDDLEIVMEPEDSDITLEIGFQISGKTVYSAGGICRAGDNFLAIHTPCTTGQTIGRSSQQRTLQVDIQFDRFDAIAPILQERRHYCSPKVWEWFEALLNFHANSNKFSVLYEGNYQSAKRCNFRIGRTSLTVQKVLKQLLHCPYQGALKKMYVESKVLELLTLYFAQLEENGWSEEKRDRIVPHPKLQADDIDRIYRARDILRDCLENPPSLLSLARQVGLNDYKLKLGFQHVFGTTAFGYLYQHRMECAGQMLQEKRLTVGEVARAVGYASRSSFVKAFRKKFGVNPSAYP